jgi:transmembrane 9 superfamily protein 1
MEIASSSGMSAPCRTRLVPRELPSLVVYHRPLAHAAIGGLLTFRLVVHALRIIHTCCRFSSISVELYYVLATVWGREQYTLYHIVLLTCLIMLCVSAASSVAITYFTLANEDYRWPWRAAAQGA